MKAWPVQDAKARLSEFLKTCLAEGPQMVTKRGAEAAARPSLKQLLLADQGRGELALPARGQARRRAPTPAR